MAQFEHRPYMWAPEEYLLANGAGYHQFPVQREKTPGSLCNHTGLTPTPSGPLSTPHSRDNSQPPEQSFGHPPEPMNWEDGPDESYSTSPTTSIRTPDDGSFDEEMQDAPQAMRDFYQYGEPSTQATDPVDVMDFTSLPPPGFSTPEVQAAFIDAAFSNFPQLNTQFMNSQHQLPPNPRMQMPSQLPYNQQYGTAYTRQPHQQEPWNSQVPPRMPNEPHSEVALFDPASDPERMSYLENWTANHTDPRILVSPSDPSVPPLDQYFFDPTTISPVQMEQTVSSTSSFNGSYNGNFTYPPTQFFPETTYLHQSMSFPSPGISIHSTHAHLSPILGAISPLASAPSPGSDVISSHTSDHGITLDNYPMDRPDTIRPPPSPVQVKINSPASTTPDRDAFGPDPPKQHHASRASNRPGGRAVGTHLEPKVAKAAHDMRKIVACWHCVLQRDKCGPGDTCDRCLKRAQRPNTDCGLGCSRVKLIELTQYFLPPVVSSMHEDAQLTHFVSRHIRQWGNVEITIQMTAGQNGLPRIPVKVYEFLPATQELLWQVQYKTCPRTQKIIPVKKASPPLGMVHINHNEEKKYDKYINEIVENHLDAFSRLAWGRDTNDFQEKLFGLLIRMTPRNDEEAKLLREVFRLIVVTYIMGRTLTIAEEDKSTQLSKLHFHPGPDGYAQNFCSPRMTNRQLKYFFHRIHMNTLSAVLNKLQQIFKSSKGCDKWLAAFLAVIGLAMSFEEQQKTIHLIMQTQAKSGECTEEAGQNRAECTCREIDNKFMFVAQIFRWKYNRKCNPLRDVELEWEKEVGFADAGSVAFVRQVANLVKENTDFLSVRQSVSISGSNQSKYTSRLVGQFLLSFWLPS